MRLDITLPELVASCCDDLVYAILFDKDQRALKDNGFGVLVLTPYTSVAHASFAIPLAEHAQRFKYYSADLLDANFVLPDNPKGEFYQVEYWLQPVGGTFDRTADTLRETRRIVVADKKIVDATLSAAGVKELANIQAHISAVYDSENNILRVMTHLDSNGALITDSQSATIEIVDNAGNTILSSNSNTFLNNQSGVFYIELPGVNLPNDQIFVAKCTIIDNLSVPHVTVSYLNTWD
jgi:hypothetical protein